jgi:hypothetical protein
MVVLNTTNITSDTPAAIKDWLVLIDESIKNPNNPKINLTNPAIAKAFKLADFNNVDPEAIHEAKIQEMRKELLTLQIHDMQMENIKKALELGKLSVEDIAGIFDKSVEFVLSVKEDIEKEGK